MVKLITFEFLADSKKLISNATWVNGLPENLKTEMSCVMNELNKNVDKELPMRA